MIIVLIKKNNLFTENLQEIELDNTGTAFIALNQTAVGSSALIQSQLKQEPEDDTKPDISNTDSTDLGYSLGLEDDQGTTFSILQFGTEESSDTQDSGLCWGFDSCE